VNIWVESIVDDFFKTNLPDKNISGKQN